MKTTKLKASASGIFSIGGDLPVHRLGFGAMRITGPGIWGNPKDPKEAKAVLKRAVELGVNFFDTADSYGPEVSENLIAETLYPYPKDLVIATKGGLIRPSPTEWETLGKPDYLRQCVEMSLRRLRLECIDLYQFHHVDPEVPLEDSIGALKIMQGQGKIRHIGLSEVSIPEIERAKKIVNVVSVQNMYNMMNRRWEKVLDYCEKENIAFIPWYPLGAGELVHDKGKLDHIAKNKGISPVQLALAWLLKRSSVMIPIPGTSSVKHLEENVESALIELSKGEFEELSR